MEVLIDADIVTYRAGFACENEALAIALWQADQIIYNIIKETGASSAKLFLTGSNNFRYGINPQYKANRKEARRPKWLQELREHLVMSWKASVSDGIEADDAMGIAQDKVSNTTTIASIDKDLKCIPGQHYNFVTKEWTQQSEIDALRFFYCQLIQGDKADNVEGFDGKMRPKVPKFLQEKVKQLYEMTDEKDMYAHVATMWNEARDDDWKTPMMVAAQCLWIQRKEGDVYNPPI